MNSLNILRKFKIIWIEQFKTVSAMCFPLIFKKPTENPNDMVITSPVVQKKQAQMDSLVCNFLHLIVNCYRYVSIIKGTAVTY